MKKRNGKIDLLRFLFAFFVMALHYGYYPKINIGSITLKIACEGGTSVGYFLIISGVFLAVSADKDIKVTIEDDTVSYLWRRYKQLIKYFLVALFLHFILDCFRQDVFSAGINLINTLPMSLMLGVVGFNDSDIYSYGYYLTASWYISALFLCCIFLYPIMHKNLGKFVKIYALPIFVVAISCYIRNVAQWTSIPYALTYIMVGIIIYYVVKENKAILCSLKMYQKIIIGIIELVIYAFVFIWMSSEKLEEMIPRVTVILILAIAIFITYSDMVLWSGFDSPVFTYIGKITLPLYLLHGQVKAWGLYLASLLNLDTSKGLFYVMLYVISISLSVLCVVIDNYLDEFKNSTE